MRRGIVTAAMLFLWTLLVLYPNPFVLTQAIQNSWTPDIDPAAVRDIAATLSDDPEKIEADLMELVARKDWTKFSHAMIFHGRRICIARKPRCPICPLFDDCPYPKWDREDASPAESGKGRRRNKR